jgi:hypothetical protein
MKVSVRFASRDEPVPPYRNATVRLTPKRSVRSRVRVGGRLREGSIFASSSNAASCNSAFFRLLIKVERFLCTKRVLPPAVS